MVEKPPRFPRDVMGSSVPQRIAGPVGLSPELRDPTGGACPSPGKSYVWGWGERGSAGPVIGLSTLWEYLQP